MRVETISTFYNDEVMAELYCRHYEWVDRINAFVDVAGEDGTVEVLARFPNVNIQEFEFPAGMDDVIKADLLNGAYRRCDADWILMVDADEFVFSVPYELGMRGILEQTVMSDVMSVKLFNVYRHWTDKDVDVSKPPLFQRRHGDPNTSVGENAQFNKPCIVRGRRNVVFHIGNHYISCGDGFVVGGNNAYGAHWCNADASFCVDRRLRAKARQSADNLEHGRSLQHHHVTRQSITAECASHLHDPEVI